MIEDTEVIPACRILCRDGQPCDEVIAARPRFDESFSRFSAPKVGRPRVANPKHKPIQNPGSGKGSNLLKFPTLTLDKILLMRADMMSTRSIAAHFGCSRHLVLKKLRDYNKAEMEKVRV